MYPKSSPSSFKRKNEWKCNFTHPVCLRAVHTKILTFTFNVHRETA